MSSFLNKTFKTLTMTICCSLLCVGLLWGSYKIVIGIYHDTQPHTISQYGPKTTATGNIVTIILKETGFFDSYRLSVWIIRPDGFTYERDITTDNGYRSKDDMLNLFVEYVDNTREGAYEDV